MYYAWSWLSDCRACIAPLSAFRHDLAKAHAAVREPKVVCTHEVKCSVSSVARYARGYGMCSCQGSERGVAVGVSSFKLQER